MRITRSSVTSPTISVPIPANLQSPTTARKRSVNYEMLPEPAIVLDHLKRMELKAILRAHSVDNAENVDDCTDVYIAKFAPEPPKEAADSIPVDVLHTPHTLLTVGGTSCVWWDSRRMAEHGNESALCKYYHFDIEENWFAADWQFVPLKPVPFHAKPLYDNPIKGKSKREEMMESNTASWRSLVAVGGQLGVIRVIDVIQRQCYAQFRAHARPLTCLLFDKFRPTRLYSSSEDAQVKVWQLTADIALAPQLLHTFTGFDTPVLCMTLDEKRLWCAAADHTQLDLAAVYACDPALVEGSSSSFPVELYRHSNFHSSHVDAITLLGKDRILSRGSLDQSILIWQPDTKHAHSNAVHVQTLPPRAPARQLKGRPASHRLFTSLKRPAQKTYTMHWCLVPCQQESYVLIDPREDGTLGVYELNEKHVEKEPCLVLSHPQSNRMIRMVTLSADHRTLIAVNERNMILVWECDP